MLFTFEVVETRAYVVQYTVEADSLDEGVDLANVGSTVDEAELKCDGVIDRQIIRQVTE